MEFFSNFCGLLGINELYDKRKLEPIFSTIFEQIFNFGSLCLGGSFEAEDGCVVGGGADPFFADFPAFPPFRNLLGGHPYIT